MKFFIWHNDQQAGPYEEEEIKAMLVSKQIAQDTLACLEGDEANNNWIPVKDLFPQDFIPESFTSAISSLDKAILEHDSRSFVKVCLNSGLELNIKALCFYNEKSLAELNSKKAQAAKMLEGVSTGLGAIGSIEWVLTASAVMGATETILSAGTASIGLKVLREAIETDRRLRGEGVFMPVNKIESINHPVPSLWRARVKHEIKTQVIKTFQTPKLETQLSLASYIHNGDEFLSVMADDDSVHSIRWNAVEHFIFYTNH